MGLHKQLRAESGISIIELLIVLVIVGILATFAITQLGNSKTFAARENYARELKISLERARFDSVKRRAENFDDLSRVTLESSTSFSTWIDLNQNGKLDEAEKKLVSLNGSMGIKIVGNNLIFPISIRFNRRGQVIVVDGSSTEIPANFTICSDNCTLQTATAKNSNIITVSPTGTVSMSEGESTQPTFQNPNVTSVSSNSGVNPWVGLPQENSSATNTATDTGSNTNTNSNTSSNTNSNSNTNTSSNTNTNTNTNTNSNTNTNTNSNSNTNTNTNTNTNPSTTPTPRFCNSGERPGSTGCQCKLPMTVRNNGKCM